MRLIPILLCLTACAAPLDGPLPVGTWGGEHWLLVVEEAGEGVLETDCAHGEALDYLEATEGELEVGIDWVLEGGASDPEHPPDPVPAALTATVRGERLVGVLTEDEGAWAQEVEVRLGAEPALFKCQ